MRALFLAGVLVWVSSALAQPPSAPAPQPEARSKVRQLPIVNKEWKGDFDGMLERRMIRFAVPYSRTLYYSDKGRERGLSAELARDFVRFVNHKYHRELGKRPVTVVFIPARADDLLTDVANGFADIAVGNPTVTESRLKLVDFVAPADRKPSTELVLTHVHGPAIASIDDLAGKTVHVRRSSSYHESLQALNDRFKNEGKAQVKLELVPDELEDEDMMEMLNAGLLQVIVIDDWKARMWAQILPNIRVNEQAAVGTRGVVGWAIRRDSPELRAVLEAYYNKGLVKKERAAEYRFKQATKQVEQIKNNAQTSERKKFQHRVASFQKYGERYNLDPLLLAAQAYQESQLDRNTNDHVRARHLDNLMNKYFRDVNFSETDRTLFAFASYNAGPANIAKMRTEAANRGLDPNKWFNNVEIVTAERIGMETTTYVRNIYKYYVSYQLTLENLEEAKKPREQAAPSKK